MEKIKPEKIKEIAKRYNVPESLVAATIKRCEERFDNEFGENSYKNKRFMAYTHWCNENNKEYNESERDKFYKQYDAEQQIKEDFKDE